MTIIKQIVGKSKWN